ncbi:MAG: HAMP domain-containing sensor histidine kinase [Rhodospirillales bacterium]|jgi:signal transduction histidine kinase|nr:HAMP domain-containing sensor histidine kinase [Rhodospirillales bacterium]
MADDASTRRPVSMGLSARLLLLTVFFVMVAELLIYTPSIARFRQAYLEDHLNRAHLATVALDAAPELGVSKGLGDEVLAQTGVHAIVLRAEGRHILVVRKEMPPAVDAIFDMRQGNFVMWIVDAFAALGQDENRIIRVLGPSPKGPETTIEVVLDESPMREAMYGYSNRILQLSIVISLITAGLVYLSLQLLLVRPMRRITDTMTSFREDPEDMSRALIPSTRSDEIGVAQRELAVMQEQLRAALRQKTRLATLGAAVAKINHDLRNSLSTAVLISDRLAEVDDPEVKKVTPRLYQSIDRAVELCSQTLNFVADATPPLKPVRFGLRELVAEAGESIRAVPDTAADTSASRQWLNGVPEEFEINADRQQLFRVFANLGENAFQAGGTNVRVSASANGDRVVIDVTDDGPGIPVKARHVLFRPFAGSARVGGTGLGLVIARDVMHAHGGEITLVHSRDDGTTFRLEFPAQPRGPATAP